MEILNRIYLVWHTSEEVQDFTLEVGNFIETIGNVLRVKKLLEVRNAIKVVKHTKEGVENIIEEIENTYKGV